ncbi:MULTISPECIES: acyl-CoA dehydrogenase family protein [Micromonospora]|uniref:Methoxymalonate biosynthesis protein n=1 Tax=Micromonospora matsumotoense TaxID=121616 RepID=A0A1C5ART5_9ACTN|nr:MULTISPECIES: acyl-CoA dehydrogenase family protein [Micromonospora]SCF47922.1 methoxymalonate biosynthesis protein [Micromonospora matsumotoense]
MPETVAATAPTVTPAQAATLAARLVGDRAGDWDRAGRLPVDVVRALNTAGLLAPQIPTGYGGAGWSSLDSGEFTAQVGSLCSSLRSVMTSQAMAAWTIERLADRAQARSLLPRLAATDTAAVAFSEPQAGSDLSAMTTTVTMTGDTLRLDGHKVWVTAADHADLLLVFARLGDQGAVVVVPRATPGVRVHRRADPLGCRAAGHADVWFDAVRLPTSSLLGAGGQSLSLLVTTALSYGRMSVAWGCVGILRACLTAAVAHAGSRHQFGRPLAQHQLVARHLADLWAAEQVATRVCEHASRCWDTGSPEVVTATVLAKYVSAGHATRAAADAVQILASAGAVDGHPVARAYRDAKLMEIIEGSTEMCQLMLADHAVNRR